MAWYRRIRAPGNHQPAAPRPDREAAGQRRTDGEKRCSAARVRHRRRCRNGLPASAPGGGFRASEAARIEQLARQQLATQSQLAAANKTLADAEAALHAQENNRRGSRAGAGRRAFRRRGDVPCRQPRATGWPPARRCCNWRAPAGSGCCSAWSRMTCAACPARHDGQRGSGIQHRTRAQGRVAQVFGMINPQTQLVDVLVEVARRRAHAGHARACARLQLSRTDRMGRAAFGGVARCPGRLYLSGARGQGTPDQCANRAGTRRADRRARARSPRASRW